MKDWYSPGEIRFTVQQFLWLVRNLASKLLSRKCIIEEIEEKYCEIAAKRCSQSVMALKI